MFVGAAWGGPKGSAGAPSCPAGAWQPWDPQTPPVDSAAPPVVVEVFFNGVKGWVVFSCRSHKRRCPIPASVCAAPVVGVGSGDAGIRAGWCRARWRR